MKKVAVIFLCVMILKLSAFASRYTINTCQAAIDTAKKEFIINLANNTITKGLNYLGYDIFKDTLYLSNNNKLVKISLKTGGISTDPKINAFFAKKVKAGRYVKQIFIRDNGYYFNCLDELDFVAFNGKVIKTFGDARIDDFAVMPKGVMLSSNDLVEYRDKVTGATLSKLAFGTSDVGFIRCTSGIADEADDEEKIAEFNIGQANKITTRFYPPINKFKNIEFPLIAYADERFFFVFSDVDRTALYVIKKAMIKYIKKFR